MEWIGCSIIVFIRSLKGIQLKRKFEPSVTLNQGIGVYDSFKGRLCISIVHSKAFSSREFEPSVTLNQVIVGVYDSFKGRLCISILIMLGGVRNNAGTFRTLY